MSDLDTREALRDDRSGTEQRRPSHAHAFTPGAPPTRLRHFFLVARASATRALHLFCLADVCRTRALLYLF